MYYKFILIESAEIYLNFMNIQLEIKDFVYLLRSSRLKF